MPDFDLEAFLLDLDKEHGLSPANEAAGTELLRHLREVRTTFEKLEARISNHHGGGSR